MLKQKLVFIGAGNMAEALIKGIIESGLAERKDVYASDIRKERLEYLSKNFGINIEFDNREAVKKGDIIFLAVKPQVLKDILKEIKDVVKDKLIISIAAGKSTKSIEDILGKISVVRVMPNTPVLVKKGMSAISRGRYAGMEEEKIVHSIFSAVGKAIIIKEELMDAVTSVSGSGPAYIFYIMESMIEAGQKLGLSQNEAEILVYQTILGAAELVLASGKKPSELRAAVSSPGGTTLAGLKVLEERFFKDIMVSAVEAAYRRSKELN